MLKRSGFVFIAAALLAGIFLYGVLRLFTLRYESGKVYPPYSTLRTDPLGAKAIHDALGELPGVRVERNFRALPRLRPPAPITLVYAGVARHTFWQPKELETFEVLVRGGSRAVFAFFPADRPPTEFESRRAEEKEKKEKEKKETTGKEKKEEEEEKEEDGLIAFREVAERWGFDFAYLPAEEKKTFARTAIATAAGGAIEPQISWHSALYFKDLAPEWTTLYTSDGQPVVVERKFGDGSIVLAGDSFFLSNEALRRERHPQLLGRIFTGATTVVFDEEHLGVREQPGLATLARKYRLHGTAVALALLAALYAWKSAARFLPPREDAGDERDVVTGKESTEGFVNLLRRTIKPSEVLGVCVEEWRKTAPHASRERAQLEEAWAAEQARAPKERNAVAAYRTISQILTRNRSS